MADERIVTSIVANSDFSNLIADVQRVTSSLFKLQQEFAGANRALAGQIDATNAMFKETMLKTGQFSTHFVSLTSDVEKFGRNLDSGRLKLRDYFRVYQEHSRTSGGLIRDLAKQQVQLQNAVLQPLGKNAQGLMQYNVHIPRGLDLVKNKTALLKQELQIMNKVIQDGGVQLINWGKNTQWAGRQLTVGLTLPLVAFGKAAADAFKVADQELTRLAKVYGDIGGATAQELSSIRKEVSQTAKELSAAMGVSFTETISLAADIAATGKTGNELLSSVSETTRLAVLGEVDRQEAMKATLAIQTAFKQNTEELSDSINFLNAVENQTSTSLNDLVEAIPKAGPVVKSLGGDIKDLALYITAMREGGINASESANALKSGLASLINPTKQSVGVMKDFGIDILGMVKANAGDTTALLFDLQKALDNLDPLSKAQAIEQLFGKFQFARISALLNNLGREGSQTLQVLDLMGASAAELESVAGRELSAVTESAAGRYRRAIESLKADLAGVGDEFLNIATKLVTVFNKVIEFGQKLPDPIKKILTFGAAFTAIIGPVIMLTGVLANFFGYIIKGIGHFKALFKGAEGFKLLTPEIVAARAAAGQLTDEFYSDALAADTLRIAIKKLADDLALLQQNAVAAKTATTGLGQAITTAAGTPVVAGGGPRVVNPAHPLLGPASRASAHLNPRNPNDPATIFGLTLQPIPVNRRIGANPQILMEERLPDVEGLTTVSGVSTGVVAGEHARYQALMATLGLQSKKEIQELKKTIKFGGQVSSEFMATFDDILPITQELSANAARQSAAIVAELRAGKISVQQARDAIIAVNAQLEREMGTQITAYGATRGRTIDLTKAPLIDQPIVDAAGKPNTRGMFRTGIFRKVMEAVGRATRTKTYGGPYSIETTRPQGLNYGGKVMGYAGGGDVYMTDGSMVPGPNVNADVVPAMLTPGEFVLTRGTVEREGFSAVQALHEGNATIVPFQANKGGRVPGVEYLNGGGGLRANIVRQLFAMGNIAKYRKSIKSRVSATNVSRAARDRDAMSMGQRFGHVWATRNNGIRTAIDDYLNSLPSGQKRKAAQAIEEFGSQITTGRGGLGAGRARDAFVIEAGHLSSGGRLDAMLKQRGLPPLSLASRTHATHLTRAEVRGGRRFVSGYTVDYDAMSNLQANQGTLRVTDFLSRNMGRSGKYDRIFRRTGVPRSAWASSEAEIDRRISTVLAGKGDMKIGDERGDILFESLIPAIDDVIVNSGGSPSQVTALKRNTVLRRNRGGSVPGYRRGGSIRRPYGYARGVQNKFAGGAVLKLLAALGISMGGQRVGERVGGGAGTAISTASSILPFLMMPGMGGMGSGITSGQRFGTTGSIGLSGSQLKQSIFAPSTGSGLGRISVGGGRLASGMDQMAQSSNKFAASLGKVFAGMTRFNLILGTVVAGIGLGVKVFNDYRRTQELSAAEFGMTAEQAEKAGLKYTDYNQKIKDAVDAQKLLIAQNRLTYQSMTSAGTPFRMTITEYKKLRKEIKDTMGTQIEMLNAVSNKDVGRVAVQLKEQLMAAGLSAEEASKRIYTLFQLSNKSSLTISAMNTKPFADIINAQTAAVSAINSFNYAKSFENARDQAASLNTALTAINSGISNIYDEAEKAAAKKKQDFDSTRAMYNAEKTQLEMINSRVKSQQSIGIDVLKNLEKQNPLIKQFANAQDSVVSLWQKMRIAARGYTGDLAELNRKQTERLYTAQIAIAEAVEQTNRAGLLKEQYDEYERLRGIQEDLANATKAQSVKEQISARDAIRAIDKKIKKINEEADARKKALREEAQAEDIALRIQKQRMEYEKMVSAGDFTGAAEARLELQRLLNEQQTTIAEQQIEEKRLRDVRPLERQRDRLQRDQEKLADKAALAAESLDSVTKRLNAQKEKIDAVNNAMSRYVIALDTGKNVKGAAAALVTALQEAGEKVRTATYIDGGKPTELTAVEIANKYLKDAKVDVNKILAEKNIEIEANGDIVINGKKINADRGSSSNPIKLGSAADMALNSWSNPFSFGPASVRERVKALAEGRGVQPGSFFTLEDKNGKAYKFKVREDGNITMVSDPYEKKYMGGFIRGQGTATSDSIPAMLSNGEYVINAASVSKVGVPFLDKINGMKDGGLMLKYDIPRYSLGGEVVPTTGQQGASVNISNTFTINAADGMNVDDLVNKVAAKVESATSRALSKVGPERNMTKRYSSRSVI